MLRYNTDFAAQLTLQSLVLRHLEVNISNAAATARASNDTAAAAAIDAAALAFTMFANTTTDTLTALQVGHELQSPRV